MISYYYRNKKQKQVETLKWFKKGTWINVEDPTDDELEYLVEMFSLEPGLLRDALDPYEVPRMDVENGAIYLFTRFAMPQTGRIMTVPILMILKKDAFITISLKQFPRVDRLLSSKHIFQTTNNVSLFIKIFTQITHTYNTHLNAINKQIQGDLARIEEIGNKDMVQFITLENVLNDFNLALVRSNTLLNNLMSHKVLSLDDDEKDLIEDLSLYNGQLVYISNEILRTIVNIREARTTIITNNLNQFLKLFTSITVILTIPNMIINLYSMNVKLPYAQDPLAFFFVSGTSVGLAVILLLIFAKNKWL